LLVSQGACGEASVYGTGNNCGFFLPWVITVIGWTKDGCYG